MADFPIPRPDKILNYPTKGEMKFLFRKKLTSTDVTRGLALRMNSNFYLRTLPRPLLDVMARDGLMVRCYTPAMHPVGIALKARPDLISFHFQKPGWDQIVVMNRILIGDEIDCWSLYDAEDGPHGNLSFLIQPVGDSVVPHEAASGGTETSSEI